MAQIEGKERKFRYKLELRNCRGCCCEKEFDCDCDCKFNCKSTTNPNYRDFKLNCQIKNTTAYVSSVTFGIDFHAQSLQKCIKFENLVTEKEAGLAAEEYLSVPVTNKYYKYVRGDDKMHIFINKIRGKLLMVDTKYITKPTKLYVILKSISHYESDKSQIILNHESKYCEP